MISDDEKSNSENEQKVHVLTEDSPETTVSSSDSASSSPNLAAELEEMKKQYLYLRADFDNYRKQAIKERSDLVKFGGEPVIREVLHVLDDLERSLQGTVTAENINSFKDGVSLICQNLKKVMTKFGVEEVVSEGQKFDPNIHEALSSASIPDKDPETVVQVFKKAYRLHGKLIRAAQVVVNSYQKEG